MGCTRPSRSSCHPFLFNRVTMTTEEKDKTLKELLEGDWDAADQMVKNYEEINVVQRELLRKIKEELLGVQSLLKKVEPTGPHWLSVVVYCCLNFLSCVISSFRACGPKSFGGHPAPLCGVCYRHCGSTGHSWVGFPQTLPLLTISLNPSPFSKTSYSMQTPKSPSSAHPVETPGSHPVAKPFKSIGVWRHQAVLCFVGSVFGWLLCFTASHPSQIVFYPSKEVGEALRPTFFHMAVVSFAACIILFVVERILPPL